MEYFFGQTRPAETFLDLLEQVPPGELRTVTRSTVPLLAWASAAERVQALFRMITGGDATQATFEYRVPSGCDQCGGRGKASFTDLMLESADAVVAIEAKHTERLYEQVGDWRVRGTNKPNRERVLEHWGSCILGSAATPAELNPLVYQMVHRAASARAAADVRKAYVLHLLFDSSHEEEYQAASAAAQRILSPSGEVTFSVVPVNLTRGAAHETLRTEDADRRAKSIRTALLRCDDTVYAFPS